MAILDIHTHHSAPQPEGVIATRPDEFNPVSGQLYSVGIHPWDTLDDIPAEMWDRLEEAARHPQVVAIGECGIDLIKGGPLFRQMQILKRQAILAEEIRKPLVLHNVHGQEVIIGMKKDLNPEMNWLIHGFRGKPTVAAMFAKAGLWLSFGQRFNDRALPEVPADRLLAETDEADCRIEDVISSLSSFAGRDLTATIAENSARFLGGGES